MRKENGMSASFAKFYQISQVIRWFYDQNKSMMNTVIFKVTKHFQHIFNVFMFPQSLRYNSPYYIATKPSKHVLV